MVCLKVLQVKPKLNRPFTHKDLAFQFRLLGLGLQQAIHNDHPLQLLVDRQDYQKDMSKL